MRTQDPTGFFYSSCWLTLPGHHSTSFLTRFVRLLNILSVPILSTWINSALSICKEARAHRSSFHYTYVTNSFLPQGLNTHKIPWLDCSFSPLKTWPTNFFKLQLWFISLKNSFAICSSLKTHMLAYRNGYHSVFLWSFTVLFCAVESSKRKGNFRLGFKINADTVICLLLCSKPCFLVKTRIGSKVCLGWLLLNISE